MENPPMSVLKCKKNYMPKSMSYCPLSTGPLFPGTVVKSSGEVTQREVRAWVKDEVGDLDLSQLDLDREQFQYNKILQIGIKTTMTARDIKRSPPFLVLQTPSKSFRHCLLPRLMWGLLWEVKSMSGIFKSSHGGKLILHISKLEWFKSKQIWADRNVFICSQGPYRADRDLLTLFCVQEKF